MIETSVIVPTLNDVRTVTPTIERLNRVLAATSSPSEVLIVDAGSTDDTVEAASKLADRFPLLHIRVLVQERRYAGFGTVVRLGIAYASGRFCVVVMSDARDPLELIPAMITQLRQGAHLVLCSRYEEPRHPPNVPRRFVLYQTLYRRAIRLLLGYDIPDSTYGFRAFNRTFVQALGITGRRFSVYSEITFKVLLAGGEMTRIPGNLRGPLVTQQPKFRLGHELAGYALTLVRASLHRAGFPWF